MLRGCTYAARPVHRCRWYHSCTPVSSHSRSLTVNTSLYHQYVHAAGPFVPIAQLVPALPRLSYQLFFDQQTEAAIAELNKDVRRTLRATLRTSKSPVPPRFLTNPNSFMAEWNEVAEVRTVTIFENHSKKRVSVRRFRPSSSSPRMKRTTSSNSFRFRNLITVC